MDIIAIGEGRELLAWIAAGLLELPDNVVKSELTDLIAEALRLFDDADSAAKQIRNPFAKLAGEILEQRIAFRMDTGIVERIGSARDTEKTGGLLKGLLAEARNLEQLLT